MQSTCGSTDHAQDAPGRQSLPAVKEDDEDDDDSYVGRENEGAGIRKHVPKVLIVPVFKGFGDEDDEEEEGEKGDEEVTEAAHSQKESGKEREMGRTNEVSGSSAPKGAVEPAAGQRRTTAVNHGASASATQAVKVNLTPRQVLSDEGANEII